MEHQTNWKLLCNLYVALQTVVD